MSMDSELSQGTQSSPTPKLSLFSLPHHTPDPPSETLTPPIQTPASVPFKWEEVPGKPRRSLTGDGADGGAPAKPKAARCLELPPGKITNTPSPNSVLDGPESGSGLKMSGEGKFTSTPSPGSGPEVCKTSSFSFRKFLKGEGKITDTPSPGLGLAGLGLGPTVSKTMSFSFRKFLKGNGNTTNTPSPSSGLGLSPGPEEDMVWKLVGEDKINFSSLRWGSERGVEEESEGNFDFSSPFEENGPRLRKRTGFWANIYRNVKQAVPWKRRQDKKRKMNI